MQYSLHHSYLLLFVFPPSFPPSLPPSLLLSLPPSLSSSLSLFLPLSLSLFFLPPAPPLPKVGGPPDQLHVVDLFNKLIDFGMITEDQEESRNSQKQVPPSSMPQQSQPSGPTEQSYVPLNIPNLTFTVATLKQ